MSQSPKPSAKVSAKDDTRYKHTTPLLLDSKQWSYVQRRYNLTARERQIAELICQGLQNGSIARHLRIRPGTVKTHTRNIYRKVRVKSKIAMLLNFVTDARELFDQDDGKSSIHIAD